MATAPVVGQYGSTPPTGQQAPLEAWNPSWSTDPSGQYYGFNGVSEDPSLTVGGNTAWTTKQQAEDAWFAAHPEYAQYRNQVGNAPTNPGQPPSAAQQAQTSAQALSQPEYLGQPATVTATNADAAKTDVASVLNAWTNPNAVAKTADITGAQSTANTSLDKSLTDSLTPDAAVAQILKSFAAQSTRSENNLQQTLANFGITGGQAVGADVNLQGQLAASIAPALAQAIEAAQTNQLNAGEFNVKENVDQSMSNAGLREKALEANQASQLATNLEQGTIDSTNASNKNNFRSNAATTDASNAQQTALANALAANNANAYNASALNSTNAANVAEYNQNQSQLLNDILNQYYAQLGEFGKINNSGQGASNQQAVNYGGTITTQQDPFTSIFTGLAQGAGSYFGAKH